MIHKLFAFIIFGVLFSHGAVRVAVLPFFGDSSLPAQQKEFLSGELVTELTKIGAYTVLERNRMAEILKEQGFQMSGACDQNACQVQMGQLLGVDFLIVPSISKFDKNYSFHMDLVNVATGSIDRALSYRKPGLLGDIYHEILQKAAYEIAGLKPIENPKSNRKWVMPLSIGLGVAGLASGIIGLYQDNVLHDERKQYEEAAFDDRAQADRQWNRVTDAEFNRNLFYGISCGLLASGLTIYLAF